MAFQQLLIRLCQKSRISVFPGQNPDYSDHADLCRQIMERYSLNCRAVLLCGSIFSCPTTGTPCTPCNMNTPF